MSKRADSSTQSWESVADDWIAHADTNDYRNNLLMPLTLRMIGDVRGRKVLDLGCGEGGYTREIAGRGALVVGVDGSERLIEVARERTVAQGLEASYLAANASHMPELESGRFDLVVAAMSLMDVEDYAGAISEIYRVLRASGQLIMSITHPCFTPRVSKWIKDDAGRARFFAVDQYFERGAWDDHITSRFTRPVLRRHRPLEDYMAAPLKTGFTLRDFCEPSATDAEVKMSPRFWKLQRIPYFLFLRWEKSA